MAAASARETVVEPIFLTRPYDIRARYAARDVVGLESVLTGSEHPIAVTSMLSHLAADYFQTADRDVSTRQDCMSDIGGADAIRWAPCP